MAFIHKTEQWLIYLYIWNWIGVVNRKYCRHMCVFVYALRVPSQLIWKSTSKEVSNATSNDTPSKLTFHSVRWIQTHKHIHTHNHAYSMLERASKVLCFVWIEILNIGKENELEKSSLIKCGSEKVYLFQNNYWFLFYLNWKHDLLDLNWGSKKKQYGGKSSQYITYHIFFYTKSESVKERYIIYSLIVWVSYLLLMRVSSIANQSNFANFLAYWSLFFLNYNCCYFNWKI